MSHIALSFTPQRSARIIFWKWKWDSATALLETVQWLLLVWRVSSEALSIARGAHLTYFSFSPLQRHGLPFRPWNTQSQSVPQQHHRNLFCSPFHQHFPGMGHERARDRKPLKSFPRVQITPPLSHLTFDGDSGSWTPNWVWTSSQISTDVPFGICWGQQISMLRSFHSFHLEKHTQEIGLIMRTEIIENWRKSYPWTVVYGRIQEGIRIKMTCFFPTESVIY